MIRGLPRGNSVVARLSRLFALCSVVAVGFLLLRGGWPGPSSPARPAKDLVGEWVVVSIDGVKIPEGATVTVDYKADGRLLIRQIGGDQSFVLPDAAKLKKALDEIDPALARSFGLKLRTDGFEIELRRKPGDACENTVSDSWLL